MNVCLIGNNLTSLILAKILSKKNFHVDILTTNSPQIKFQTRSLGISEYNLNYLDIYFNNISKKTKKICKIKVLIKNGKNDEEILFDKDATTLFNMIQYDKFASLLQKNIKFNKKILFKKIKKKNDLQKLISNKKFKLIINCEKSNFLTKKFLKSKIIKNYHNTAFTTIIKHKKIKNNTATQIFTNYGPIAFLPLSDFTTSIVFSFENNNKKAVTQLEILELIKLYNPLYKITSVDKIESFNLNFKLPRSYSDKNILFFGDSIHSIHPLAGQGFNMTIRDIIKLIKIIDEKINLGLSIDQGIYKEFEKNVKSYNSMFSLGIDFIHEFFKFNKNYIPKGISKKIFYFINKNKKIKDLGIKFANQGILITE
tara:strand:+ start:5636 stop:6742 length:1107 start_codon:yes stop_codon:yes gene_type:complete